MEDFRFLSVSVFFTGTDEFGSMAIAYEPPVYNQINYQPFGYQRDSSAGHIGFADQFQEPGIKYYMLGNGYRLYTPTLYRFCTADSHSPFAQGGINAYSYCKADPINLTDPSGHSPLSRLSRTLRSLFRRSRGNAPQSMPQLLATRNLAPSPLPISRSGRFNTVVHPLEKSPAWTTRHILPSEGYLAADIGAYVEEMPALPRVRRAIIARDPMGIEAFRRARGISDRLFDEGSLSSSSSTTSLSSLESGGFDLPPAYEPPPSYQRATSAFRKNLLKPYYSHLKNR
jgi:RHS repeat-associated protein